MPDQYPPRNSPSTTPQGAPVEPQPIQPTPPTRPSRPKWPFVILAIVVVFALGGGAYVFTSRRQPTKSATSTAPSQPTNNENTSEPTQPTPSDSSLVQYTSNGSDLGLRFTYPASWSVTPPSSSNTSDQPITVTSPVVNLTSATSVTSMAKVVVNIRPGGTTAGELAGDKATAAQASMQIAYDKPTSVQHQYPFLTFIRLSGGSNPQGAFEEIMVTGITSFAKDQPIPQITATQFDPLIIVRFYACTTKACTSDATPLSLTNANWNNNEACQQALSILKSLQIG